MNADAIRDLLEGLGPVAIRRMFGGQGIFQNGVMFALEADGELFIKGDGENAPQFEEAGSRRFTYAKGNGKTATLNYWLLPDAASDDPTEAVRWARLGVEAARRAALPKGARKASGSK